MKSSSSNVIECVSDALYDDGDNPTNSLEECAVCLRPLCEPVPWPECSHYFCVSCMLQLRRTAWPSCPMCRCPAPRIGKVSDLEVDPHLAAEARRLIGSSFYEENFQVLWAEVAVLESPANLGRLPLVAIGHVRLPIGSTRRLRLEDHRYVEMVRRAFAPGGRRSFAVMQPPGFEDGAKGRVCTILDSAEDPCGGVHLIVESGAACRASRVESELANPGGPTLYYGILEEIQEDELVDGLEDDIHTTAAGEMVEILNALGGHLRTMRHRRMLLTNAVPGMLSTSPESNSERVNPDTQEGVDDMLNLLAAYRRTINQMDQLLSEAANTASRVESANLDESESDDSHSTFVELNQTSETTSAFSLFSRPTLNNSRQTPMLRPSIILRERRRNIRRFDDRIQESEPDELDVERSFESLREPPYANYLRLRPGYTSAFEDSVPQATSSSSSISHDRLAADGQGPRSNTTAAATSSNSPQAPRGGRLRRIGRGIRLFGSPRVATAPSSEVEGIRLGRLPSSSPVFAQRSVGARRAGSLASGAAAVAVGMLHAATRSGSRAGPSRPGPAERTSGTRWSHDMFARTGRISLPASEGRVRCPTAKAAA